MSTNSSLWEEAAIALSIEICRLWNKVASDWLSVCIPSFSWPVCIAEYIW